MPYFDSIHISFDRFQPKLTQKSNPLQSFLRGETQIPKDEAFKDCIESYLHVFLKSERVAQIVGGGALSQHDCREVFR